MAPMRSGALTEVAMSRMTRVSRMILPAFAAAIVLAALAAADQAAAQAGCQPTLTQPCAKASSKTTGQPSARKSAAESDDPNAPKDHSPRIKLDQDTDFKFGTGGLGLQRKF
jgi:hypothetical protein